jgi:hypothetical protein
MTLKQFVEDAVDKIPHASIIGEVCDLVYNKVKAAEGEEKAYMAADYFMKLANQKFHK